MNPKLQKPTLQEWGACTLHPTPCTPHPTPHTQHPTPRNPNPQPETPNPEPQIQEWGAADEEDASRASDEPHPEEEPHNLPAREPPNLTRKPEREVGPASDYEPQYR